MPKRLAAGIERTAEQVLRARHQFLDRPARDIHRIPGILGPATHIADIVVTTPDSGAQTMPLVAAKDVGKAGFFRRAWNGLMSLV